jgi:hypothetical protein
MTTQGDAFSDWRRETLLRESAARRILGVTNDAGLREIRMAYVRLAFINHPDKNTGDKFASQRFANLVNAYRTIVTGTPLPLSESAESLPHRPQPQNEPMEYFDMWRRRFARQG